jgi:hypothetical protein
VAVRHRDEPRGPTPKSRGAPFGTQQGARREGDPGLTDAEGRTGIGISLSGPGTIGSMFIFDPEPYEFLGFHDSRTSGDGADMKSYSQLTYLDGWAVTDRARQRP